MRRLSVMGLGLLLTGLLAGCSLWPEPPPTLVYRTNLEEGVNSEWSTTRTDTTPTGNLTFLGHFDKEDVHFKLPDLPDHSQVILSFDLYIIKSWEGNASFNEVGQAVGPDRWQLSVTNGPTLLDTTFSNIGFLDRYDSQAYPDSYPDGDHPAQTGASERNSLGFLYTFPGPNPETHPMDAVYGMEFTFDHSRSLLWLVFSGQHVGDHPEESWGINNVVIRVR